MGKLFDDNGISIKAHEFFVPDNIYDEIKCIEFTYTEGMKYGIGCVLKLIDDEKIISELKTKLNMLGYKNY